MRIKFKNILSEENEKSNFSIIDRKVIKFLHSVYVDKYGNVDPLTKIMGDKYYGYEIQNLLFESLINTLKLNKDDHYTLSRFMAIFILNFKESGDYNQSDFNDGLSDKTDEEKAVSKLVNIYPFWIIPSPYPIDKGFKYNAYKRIYAPANFARLKFDNTHRFLVYSDENDVNSGELMKFDAASIVNREISNDINKLYIGEFSATRNAENLDDYVTTKDYSYKIGYDVLPRYEKRLLDSLYEESIEYRIAQYYEPNDIIQTLINIGKDDEYIELEELYEDYIEELKLLESEIKKVKIALHKLYKEQGNISNKFDNYENNNDNVSDIESEIYELKYELDELTKDYEEKRYDYNDIINKYELYSGDHLKEVVREYVVKNSSKSKIEEIASYLSLSEYGWGGRGLSILLEKIPSLEFNTYLFVKESTTFGFQIERIMKGSLKEIEYGGNKYYILLRDFRDDRMKIDEYEE